MAEALSAWRTKLRRVLHDEDSGAYRWTNDVLDRHLEDAVRLFSHSVPREVRVSKTTTGGSRDLTLTAAEYDALVELFAVEWPTGNFPPTYVPFGRFGTTVTLQSDAAPAGAETAYLYTGQLHVTVDGSSNVSVPDAWQRLVLTGAAYLALDELAQYAPATLNVGGANVWGEYAAMRDRFEKEWKDGLRTAGRSNQVRAKRLYTAVDVPAGSDIVTGPP